MAKMDRKVEKYEILAIGTSTVVKGNVAKARKKAISVALVEGVEEYLARRLGSQGMATNFRRLIHDILPKAREVIENFTILAEEQIGRQYKILVRLKINEKVMEERFRETGFILTEGPPIKILFLVSQHEPKKDKVFFWWEEPGSESGLTPTELALHRVFQEYDLSPINRLLNVPEGSYSSDMKVLDLTDEDALRWGRIYSADVVLRGNCEIIEGKMVSVSLIAHDVEQGIRIHQDSQTERAKKDSGGMEQIIQTIEKAINRVVARLAPLIIRAVEGAEVRENQLEIDFRGFKNFKQFREFREFLEKDIEGVKSVKQTRVRINSISILVDFSGDTDRFLDMVQSHENLPFEADIYQTGEGEIIVNIR